jgi:hypothetical protein
LHSAQDDTLSYLLPAFFHKYLALAISILL